MAIDEMNQLGNFITEVRCNPLEPLSNGNYTSVAGRPGDVVEFSCDVGYRLNGNLSRQCNADGLWSGSMPTCESMVKSFKMPLNFNQQNKDFMSTRRFIGLCNSVYVKNNTTGFAIKESRLT